MLGPHSTDHRVGPAAFVPSGVGQHQTIERFPVIVGPTAGGKTALAVAVAHELGRRGLGVGEVVTADSMQVYRGLDIGTAKPTASEMAGVAHHLIDLVEPTEAFSVHQWLASAESAIDAIRARRGVPIVAGGTHLFIKALLDGLFDGPGADEAIRSRLAAMTAADRRAELARVDPQAAQRIHPNDERRTIRALEIYRLTGQPISRLQQQWDTQRGSRRDCVLVILRWPTETINRRINARVRQMVRSGLVGEVESLDRAGVLGLQAREALGYKQVLAALAGRCSLDEAIEQIKIETRRFAKNQRTWLRRLAATPGAVVLDAADSTMENLVQTIVEQSLMCHSEPLAE